MKDNVPYVGIIRFNIFIHKLNADGSIDPEPLDCSEKFKNNKIANKAEIQIIEVGQDLCIEKIKKKMEKL